MSKDDGDYLGYGVYADTLWARIARALNKDAAGGTLGDDPLVVGIFGEWGSGKSRLLGMVMQRALAVRDEQISAHKHDGYAPLTIPVFFQPWKYEHEKHLLVPMLLHIVLALEGCLKQARTLDDALVGTVRRGIDGALQQIGDVVKATKTVLGVVEPGSAAALGTAQTLADTIKPGTPRKQARDFTWREDGRAYYELHDILRKVTRPGKYAEVTGGAYQDKDFGCNFVIFIDDLDRCLPEKAVEALELIKTVFNLESFAFVLALDEEVVERGIGHRYKDYALHNKKPEMPITGFEYLEKIVHLPFRLPALTRAEGLEFLRQYEEQFLKQRGGDRTPWFTKRTEASTQVVTRAGWDSLEKRRGFQSAFDPADIASRGAAPVEQGAAYFHLGHLVVNSFNAYVPRKLVRVVELFHQTLDVLERREDQVGRPRLDQVALGGRFDPRFMLAFILLQLFHPELYRACRRIGVGFDVLRDAYVSDELDPWMADVDLMRWAIFEKFGTSPPKDREEMQQRLVNVDERDGMRGAAQRIRLPLVYCLLDHRAAQRHAFNPLNLFYTLARSAEAALLDKGPTGHYFALLAEQPLEGESGPIWLEVVQRADDVQQLESHWVEETDTTTESSGATVSTPTRPIARIARSGDVRAIYQGLISVEEREQEASAASGHVQLGEVLSPAAAHELLDMLNKWLSLFGDEDARKEPRNRLLRGMRYFAPHVPRSSALAFWELVKGADNGRELGSPIDNMEQLKARELWADVRSTLGLDPRWDPSRWNLPSERHAGHNEKIEPIPGFVRVTAGKFDIDWDERSDDPEIEGDRPGNFFMARYLTTVGQFAEFIAAEGYSNNDLWDSQGIAWREGQWASEKNESAFNVWLDPRTSEQRKQPLRWAEQMPYWSRPVWGVNWFECRAYARWLTSKLENAIENVGLHGYQVRLPVVHQWMYASRAASHTGIDARSWPWGEDYLKANLRANILGSGFGRPCVVGLFAPNPLGLTDIVGNLWEFQDNLFKDGDGYKALQRLPRIRGVVESNEVPVDWLRDKYAWQDGSLIAIRGASWRDQVHLAKWNNQGRHVPVHSNEHVGFRLVLTNDSEVPFKAIKATLS